LRQHGHVLCVSERALVSPPNDELVESPFASVRLRTDASCRYKGVEALRRSSGSDLGGREAVEELQFRSYCRWSVRA
jgi:hypothetical protein